MPCPYSKKDAIVDINKIPVIALKVFLFISNPHFSNPHFRPTPVIISGLTFLK